MTGISGPLHLSSWGRRCRLHHPVLPKNSILRSDRQMQHLMSDHTVRDRRPIAPLRLDKEPHIPFVTKKKNTTPFSTLYNSCRCGGEHRELIFFDKMFVTLGSLHELRNVGYTLRGGDFLQEGKSPTAILSLLLLVMSLLFSFSFLSFGFGYLIIHYSFYFVDGNILLILIYPSFFFSY